MKPKDQAQAELFAAYLATREKYENMSVGAEAAFLRKAGANERSKIIYEKVVVIHRQRLLELFVELLAQGVCYVEKKGFVRRPRHG